MRAREHGIDIGVGEPGPLNAITDVPGVRVGHATINEGDGPLVIGKGPVRTGVTVILPHDGQISREPVFAGHHRLNGFGELTGLSWVRESGLLTTPIAITNTNSIGTVRDAVVAHEITERGDPDLYIGLPVVGETWDGILNDIRGQHVTPAHVAAAFDNAHRGVVAEGNVGGGTGMQCYGFKGGCGTSSRTVRMRSGHTYTVGVLVQANHGERRHFQVNGVPIGEVIDRQRVPFPRLPEAAAGRHLPGGTGSVIVVAATDAPLLPHQLDRLAQRAGLGVTKFGAYGENYSGDLMVAFSTAARGLPDMGAGERTHTELPVTMLSLTCIDAVFEAVIECTAEAILNAMLQAETMTGRDDLTLHALDGEVLADVLQSYRRRVFSLA